MDFADTGARGLEFLEHHGVKGQKWGVRKDHSVSSTTTKTSKLKRPSTDVTVSQKPGKFVRTSGGKRQIAADDAVKVAASRQLAKKSTTDSLSNKQLQDAVTRMNLETQFNKLSKSADRRGRGKKFVQSLIGQNKKHLTADNVEKAAKVGAAMSKAKTATKTTAKVLAISA